MVVELKKENPTPPERPAANPTCALPQARICKDCRFYNLLWLAFVCTLGGVVLPLIIIRVSDMPENSANIFALVFAIGGLCAYLFFRPIMIRAADKQFKDMGYHDHYHV